MNDGKAIIARQEQEFNIRLLAAQRRLYSKAKKFKYLQIALSIVPPVVVTFLQIAGIVTADIVLFLAVEAAMMCGAAFCGRAAAKNRDCAAKVQQAFDSDVFGIPFGFASLRGIDVEKTADVELGSRGDKDLINWYSCVREDMRAGEAISACQKMNCRWSKHLVMRYGAVSIGVPALAMTAVVLLILNLDVDAMTLVFLGAMPEWLFDRMIATVECYSMYGSLEDDLGAYNLGQRENIIAVQDRVYELRRYDYQIPDWFYFRFRQNDEKAFRR